MQYVLDIFYYSVYNNGCRWNFVIIFHPQPTISPPFSLNLLYNKHIRVFYTKLTTHASSLANTRTLEIVDVQLAWLILRALYYYYKKQYEENEDKSVLEEYIFCIFNTVPRIFHDANVLPSCSKSCTMYNSPFIFALFRIISFIFTRYLFNIIIILYFFELFYFFSCIFLSISIYF